MLAHKGTLSALNRKDARLQYKYDGTSIIVIKRGKTIILRGRSWKNDFAKNNRFPKIVKEARKIKAKSCVARAELTFYHKKTGKEKFITALAKPETKKGYIAVLEIHDLLYVNNRNLKNKGFDERQQELKKILPKSMKHVRRAKTVKGTPEKRLKFHKQALREGREGTMVKFADATYHEDKRSRDMLKLKKMYTERADTADVVVVGCTYGEGWRKKLFGALILAQRDKKGNWIFVGKSSGFNTEDLKKLLKKMRKVKTAKCPLTGRAPKNVKMWCRPKIVVEVKYHEKLKGYSMRFPSFERFRPDKSPKDCWLRGTSKAERLVRKFRRVKQGYALVYKGETYWSKDKGILKDLRSQEEMKGARIAKKRYDETYNELEYEAEPSQSKKKKRKNTRHTRKRKPIV